MNWWCSYMLRIRMDCINIFSTISSNSNLCQTLIAIAGISSEIWLFWLFSTGFSSRSWLFWIISLIGFSIESSPLWSILSPGKSWCLLMPSESQKQSFNFALSYFFSVSYCSCSSVWLNLFWSYLKQHTALTSFQNRMNFVVLDLKTNIPK